MSLRRWGAALAGAALVAGIAATPAIAADPFTPKVTVTPSAGLDPAGTKIVVKGTGFDPAANDGKGFGLRVGPAKADVRDRAGKDFQVSRLIKKGAVGTQIPVDDDGNWEYAVTVKAEYVASGTTYSAKTQPFSVFVFGWDTPALTWDSTTPVKFTGIGDPDPGPGDTAAGLGWGVRQSWRSYITRGGTVTPSNGATLDPSAPNAEPFPYHWKYGSSTWDSGKGTASYTGQVTYTFEAHTIWDFTIADPRIAIAGDGTGRLTAKIGYSFYGTKTAPQKVRPPSDVVFADLTLKAPQQVGDGVVVDIESAKLTKEGAEAFADFYKEGDALDTGRIAFPGKSGPAPTSTQPTSSVPTSSMPTSAPTSTTSSACVLTPDSAKQGNLLWGFKQSFRRYVATGSGTSITASDGVEVTDIDKIDGTGPPSGAYRWGFDSARYKSASEFTTQFRGKVTFAYPSHSFELSIGRPKVVVAQGKGTLYADVELKTTSGAPSPPINQPGVELASLDLSAAKTTEGAGVLSVAGVKVTLGNAEAFAKFYKVGEVLDEAAVTLGASCANLPGGSGPGTGPGAGSGSGSDDLVPDVKYRPDSALASTGVESGVWLLGGLVLLGAGLLLVLVVRRRTA